MSYAFLLLTYENPLYDFRNIITNNNIYIHPKYPDKILKEYQPYVIKNLVNQTTWCEYSIVEATLNLLKMAFSDKTNEWFILVSEDTYPIYEQDEFIKHLNTDKSIFNYINKYDIYYKTSQWWILNRTDANIIISNISKYIDKFQHKINNGCIDEYYFLSVLKWNNPDYEYINMPIMYDKWLTYTIQKSPAYFNYLLDDDLEYIKSNNCMFVRKITKSFSPVKYTFKRKLYVVYIGTETNQDNIILTDEFDLILILSIKIDKIKQELVKRSIYIFNIIYKFLYETILNICNEKFIKNWEIVVFTTEKFNMNNYNTINKTKQSLPYYKFKFKDSNKNLLNIKEFYYIEDNNNQLAFSIKM